MRAVIYSRISTDLQSESSIDDQVRVCEQYALQKGWEIVGRYSDNGISGAATGNRPGFQRMMADAKNNKFDVLLILDLSRLSRSTADLNKTIDRLQFIHIRIVGISNGYDSAKTGHKLIAGIEGVIGEAFREVVSVKTHVALQGRAERGLCAGGAPFGYSTIEKDGGRRFVIVEEQANIVLEIFKLFAQGKSCKAVAYELNRLHIPSPRGTSWAQSTIYGHPKKGSGIINNELYRGELIWNRTKWIKDPDTGARKRIDRPKNEWIVRNIPELRIIPEDLWQAVKKRQNTPRRQDGTSSKGARVSTLLAGIMVCGCCGGPVTAIDERRYGCSINHNRGPDVCPQNQGVRRSMADSVILGLIRERLEDQDAVDMLKRLVSEELHTLQSANSNTVRGVRQRIAELDREIKNLTGAISKMGLSDALQQRLESVEIERGNLIQEMGREQDVGRNILVPDMVPRLLDRYQSVLGDLKTISQESPTEARETLRDLLGEVRLMVEEDGDLYIEAADPLEGVGKIILRKSTLLGLVAGTGFEPVTFGL